ncbi:MAG: tRNA (adenosine(37)-N6)-threonylcarbamoyltransferase complex transferase subunit TsaD [Chloroflexota bacterium]|nr:tRNA (adenosine(37)-N6)-threonylcarbamoyltransferase complex transferase subunit TsaD [Chloroflexota bacterium]
MLILGIETSCDETAAAVVEEGCFIRSNVIASQIEIHRKYGGVFPEMASREHIRAILPVIQRAMTEAEVGWEDLDGIAVTHGPGLAGSLLVGMNTAKGLALGLGLPLLGVNHLEGHIYSNWLAVDGEPPDVRFPFVCLIVSGGHTELVLVNGHHDYHRLGGTLDDAAGEAFDKVGRLLGLEYPGGPAIEREARRGDSMAFDLPRAWLQESWDFSFSGLKTAVLRLVRKLEREGEELPVADLAASFQLAVVDVLAEKSVAAAREFGARQVLLAGGVSANQMLRQVVRERAGTPVLYPPPILCTDNAAMIAAAGTVRFRAGERSGWDLDVLPGARLVS